MPSAVKFACKTVASSIWTSFCRLAQLLTKRAVGLRLVGSICVLSLLLTFRKYPYNPINVFANMRIENEKLQPPILDHETQARNEKRMAWNADEPPQNASPSVYPQQKLTLKGTAASSPQNPRRPNNLEYQRKRQKDSITHETVTSAKENLQIQNIVNVYDSSKQDSLKLPLEEAMSDNDNSSGKKVASIKRP